MPDNPTILFVGGGSGGHIYPNIAVLETLEQRGVAVDAHFVVSERAVDRTVLEEAELEGTYLPALPMAMHPLKLWRFVQAYRHCTELMRDVIEERLPRAVVATGGFVSGPSVSAASALDVPVALVSLDAVPGKSNRWSARQATKLFTAYETPMLKGAELISVPLRQSVLAPDDPGAQAEARTMLGLDPDKQTLLVFGGSQGGGSINQLFIEIAKRNAARTLFRGSPGWQVLHLTGEKDREQVAEVYAKHNIPGVVEAFCTQMGAAWSAASLCVCRSGAGSVAESWANAVPAIYMPYPYHRDQHQKANAVPIVKCGGALLHTDHIDPGPNVDELLGPLRALIQNKSRLDAMAKAMRDNRRPDGAAAVADWVEAQLRE
ncbi:MAG: UDP-N-acetylglucosamine--N-acetylmuramyl-(pentapeptide) pyrophosphoryl-undecaprenol N-acetylglucosamine transferase [Phycisphaerales bacterium JB063]